MRTNPRFLRDALQLLPETRHQMNKLEIKYQIRGFDRFLYSHKPSWPNCEFLQDSEESASVCIWRDNITNREQIELAKNSIEQTLKSFVLALQHSLAIPLRYRKIAEAIPAIELEDGGISLTESLSVATCVSMTVAPRTPPDAMPVIPLECETWVLTLAETQAFHGYPEECLKRHYLIIEELWDEFSEAFNSTTQATKYDLKLIRDFASHAICDSTRVVDLVSRGLPSSVVQVKGKQGVKFQRSNTTHRNYIASFEAKSREIARKLVDMKIQKMSEA